MDGRNFYEVQIQRWKSRIVLIHVKTLKTMDPSTPPFTSKFPLRSDYPDVFPPEFLTPTTSQDFQSFNKNFFSKHNFDQLSLEEYMTDFHKNPGKSVSFLTEMFSFLFYHFFPALEVSVSFFLCLFSFFFLFLEIFSQRS